MLYKKLVFTLLLIGTLLVSAAVTAPSSIALDLDWKGSFRFEANYIQSYSYDQGNKSNDTTRSSAGGYYIPSSGDSNASFQQAFMRLQPSVIVNDNIFIRSDLWLGDPIFGFFGSGLPYNRDGRFFYSSQNRGAAITAQRFWAELLTDFGTIQVGRAPLHWGLGVFWDKGDDVWSRYMSTGDTVRLVSKFGSFSFIPAYVNYSLGNAIGGACTDPTNISTGTGGVCGTTGASAGAVDYSLILLYENLDEDIELGLNVVRRIIGNDQDANGFYGIDGTSGGTNFTLWDIYGKKRLGPVTIAGEIPIVSGDIQGVSYSSFGIALETEWEITKRWSTKVLGGHAPGQGNDSGATPSKFTGFYFNPNYKLGLVMFNYQPRSFAGPNTLNNPDTGPENQLSPYDNPIVNATYLAWQGQFRLNPTWAFRTGFIWATASESASNGSYFFNTWERRFVLAAADQSTDLGWEFDFGASFNWDESTSLDWDFGFYVPGSFYAFSNAATLNPTNLSVATQLRLGIAF